MSQKPRLSTPILLLADYFSASGYDFVCGGDGNTLVMDCVGDYTIDGGEYTMTVTYAPTFQSVNIQMAFDAVGGCHKNALSQACELVRATLNHGLLFVDNQNRAVYSRTVPVATVMTPDGINDLLMDAVTECDNLYPLWRGLVAGRVDLAKLAKTIENV